MPQESLVSREGQIRFESRQCSGIKEVPESQRMGLASINPRL